MHLFLTILLQVVTYGVCSLLQTSLLLSGGSQLTMERGFTYLTGSLFDLTSMENSDKQPELITDSDKHMETFTESYGIQRYGAFWLDYLYTMDDPKSRHGGWAMIICTLSHFLFYTFTITEKSFQFFKRLPKDPKYAPFDYFNNASMLSQKRKYTYIYVDDVK